MFLGMPSLSSDGLRLSYKANSAAVLFSRANPLGGELSGFVGLKHPGQRLLHIADNSNGEYRSRPIRHSIVVWLYD